MVSSAAQQAPPVSKPERCRIIVALPAYNEEANIGGLLTRISEAMEDSSLPYQIIVVDDGSRDRTFDILTDYSRRLPVTVSRHSVNQGLGPTIRDALVLGSQVAGPRDIVVTMDADETHPPGLIARMVQLVHEGCDIVIASRYQPGGRVYGVSFPRQVFSYVASWLFRALFPIRGVKDYTCGYRAYRATALKRAVDTYGDRFVEMAGFQSMADILLKMRKLNLVFAEVPLILRYDLKGGESKMKVARTIRQTITMLLRRRFVG